MKGIIRGKTKRHYDGSIYHYFSLITKREETLTKEELFSLSETLPKKCQKILNKISLFKIPMTAEEQKDMLLLCSLSIYCWNGGPKCNLPGISMEDYTNDFYIEMVQMLTRSFKRERGPWANFVKYVRLKTIAKSIKRWEIIKRSAEVDNFHALNITNLEQPNWGTLRSLGIGADKGHKV